MADEDFDFDVIETLPADPSEESLEDAPSSEDVPHGRFQCEVCGIDITHLWAGRGRYPKKCEDHKTRTSVRSSSSPTRNTANKRLEQLEKDITAELVKVGMITSPVVPTFGYTVAARSTKVASALVSLAAKNPKLLEAMETTTKIMPALEIGETVLAIAIALLVDFGRIAPDGVVAQMTGVTDAFIATHDVETEARSNSQPANGFEVNVPPRFEPVGV